MSPSEGHSSPDVDAVLADLDSDDRATRREAAAAVSRYPLQGEMRDGDWVRHRGIDGAVIGRLAAHLTDDDPRVRGHVAGALCGEFGLRELMGEWPRGQNLRTYESVVDELFDLMDDDAWTVRQTVLTPRYLHAIQEEIARASADDGTARRWHERLATGLVDALADPVAVVRRRAGVGLAPSEHYYPLGHAAGVVAGHPDPESAVETLLATAETTGDEPYYLDGQPPHVSSSRVLAGLATHHPGWVEPHADRLRALADRTDGDSDACLPLVEALAGLPDPADAVVDTFYRRATELFRNAASFHDRTRVLAAADGPVRGDADAVDRACDLVLTGLTDRSERPRATAGATAGRLARTAPDAVPEVFLGLAETPTRIERGTVRTADDPLAVLAAPHPGFVADALKEALERLFAGTENVNTPKGMGGLLSRVAAENAAAVDPLVPRLVERCGAPEPATAQGAAWGLARIVEERPARGVALLRELLAGDGGRPPLRSGLSRIVETVAARDVETAATAVDALVETLGLPVTASDRSRSRLRADFTRTLGAHVAAARALAAIATADATLAPDWARAFTPYVEDGTYELDPGGLGRFVRPPPLFVLSGTDPAVAADRFASLFRATDSEDPRGDPADLRRFWNGVESPLARATVRVLRGLCDHEDAVVRARAERELEVAAEQSETLGR